MSRQPCTLCTFTPPTITLLNYVPNIVLIIASVPAVLFAAIQLGPGAALWWPLAPLW